jgi:P-type conjugative transfer protein TrbJ
MRNRRLFAAAALVFSLAMAAGPPPAQAQMAVIDLKAIGQAEQQVSNQLTAINNQLTQIQRLESQLSNQALMLQKMETDVTGPILSIENQATQILQNAQGIGYGAQNVAQTYANLYPSTMPGASLATTQASLATWRANNSAAIQTALQTQNQIAQGQPTTTSQVTTAVAASQAAGGQTGAIQAGNQLLATVTAQLTQLQNLLITQARAEQTLAAQAQASQTAGAADSQRFWTVTATPSRVQNPGQL